MKMGRLFLLIIVLGSMGACNPVGAPEASVEDANKESKDPNPGGVTDSSDYQE
jgi:hypothetical protein